MIDPALAPYLAAWERAWSVLPPDAPVGARRALLERLSAEAREPLPPGLALENRVVARGGRPVPVRIYAPASARPAPCLVYMHGGAFLQGSPSTHEPITAAIAAATGQVVVSIDYALAPEHPFPAALDDCAAVLDWIFAEGSGLGIRPDRVSVGGDSAGANLAAVMALRLRSRLAGQVLFYPVVDSTFERPSFTENADGPIVTTAGMRRTWELYCPDPAQRLTPDAAPLRAPDHRGMPPAFIAIAEHDPLRDDGAAYAERLAAAGVAVELHAGTGLIHGYLRAMTQCAAAREGLGAACRWLDRLSAERRA